MFLYNDQSDKKKKEKKRENDVASSGRFIISVRKRKLKFHEEKNWKNYCFRKEVSVI